MFKEGDIKVLYRYNRITSDFHIGEVLDVFPIPHDFEEITKQLNEIWFCFGVNVGGYEAIYIRDVNERIKQNPRSNLYNDIIKYLRSSKIENLLGE